MSEDKIPKGFERYQHGEPTYANSGAMLRYLCKPCVRRESCRINNELRLAMGNNYPYWNEAFVIARREPPIKRTEMVEYANYVMFRSADVPDYVDGIPSSIDEIMVCGEYEDPQLELDFSGKKRR